MIPTWKLRSGSMLRENISPIPTQQESNFGNVLRHPPYLLAVAFATAEPKQRERIGSALGKDIYRDELKDNPPTYHQVVQLFMAPAMEEFEQEIWSLVEMTDDEIRAGVEWMEAEAKKQGGARWEQWQAQSNQQKSDVDKRLAEIKSQLDNPATPEKRTPSAENRATRRRVGINTPTCWRSMADHASPQIRDVPLPQLWWWPHHPPAIWTRSPRCSTKTIA